MGKGASKALAPGFNNIENQIDQNMNQQLDPSQNHSNSKDD